jgi:hypothetical protein
MMFVACATLVGVGSMLQAQGRRGGRGGSGAPGRTAEAAKAIDADDLAKADPARALLDKAKDLKLTDREKQALDTVVKRYEWNTRVFAKDVDSLSAARRGERRPMGSAAGDSAEASGESSTTRALIAALRSIREEFTTDSLASIQKLDDGHRKAADALLGEARAKLDAVLTAGGASRGDRRGRS